MSMTPERELMSREVGELLDVPLSRIQYVLRTRKHIQPSRRIGSFSLYGAAEIEQIRAALAETQSRPCARTSKAS